MSENQPHSDAHGGHGDVAVEETSLSNGGIMAMMTLTAVVFFGSQTFGVQAATQWLIEAGSGQRDAATKRFLSKHTNVAVLVRTEVTNGMLHEPELIQIIALPDELPRASLVPDEGGVGVEDATGSTSP